MAQNITLMGASYSNVPSVQLPKTGGGTATFDDTTISSNAATAEDITSGKQAYVNGSLITGTASGGGGSNWTLLASTEYTVNTTSTSNTSVGNITLNLSDYNDYQTILWVHIRDKAGKRTGYFYGSDTMFFHYQLATGNTNSLSTRPVAVFRASSATAYSLATSAYGLFAYRLYYTSSAHYVQIYSRYNSTNSGTINGTYKCDVYKLTMPSGMTLFA
jgi:hypothetical protein